MFDPTIYENLKVVLEGTVYDLDLDGKISVLSRADNIDLSTLSRQYAIRFCEKGTSSSAEGEILLSAGLEDLAGEMLELTGKTPGCELTVRFHCTIRDVEKQCADIANRLRQLWQDRPEIRQELHFPYQADSMQPQQYRNTVTLDFGRKIDERHSDDLADIVNLARSSLEIFQFAD